jgi:flagellar basal body-associated protein FliL
MARLIVLILIVFLIAGGGVGTYWFGIRGEPLPEIPDNPISQATVNLARLPSEYVEMAPLSVPVMEEGKITELLTFVISLEMAGTRGLEAVANNRRELRDEVLTQLHALYSLRFIREHEEQLTIVKRRLMKTAQPILGDKLRGIYVQSVQGRRVGS